jgi:hypothetical protein
VFRNVVIGLLRSRIPLELVSRRRDTKELELVQSSLSEESPSDDSKQVNNNLP